MPKLEELLTIDRQIAHFEYWMEPEEWEAEQTFRAIGAAEADFEVYLEHVLDAEYEDIARNAPWAL